MLFYVLVLAEAKDVFPLAKVDHNSEPSRNDIINEFIKKNKVVNVNYRCKNCMGFVSFNLSIFCILFRIRVTSLQLIQSF